MKWIILILIVLGLVISVYLLHYHLTLAGHPAGNENSICSALFGADCDAALRSPVAIQLGIPLAGWGVIYYITLSAFLILGWSLGEMFEFEAKLAAFILSFGACLAGVVLVAMMLFGQSPICPLCSVVHLINLLLVVPLFRITSRPIPQLLSAFAAAGAYLLKGKTVNPVRARWKLLGFFTMGLIAVVLYQAVLLETRVQQKTAGVAFNPQPVIATFKAGVKQDIPLDPRDPILGPKEGPVRLTVFSDFQCPACRRFSDKTANLSKQFDGKLQIVFKHFPLSPICNPSVRRNLHPRACEAALATEAARQQGKFWAFHDALFASNLSKDENTISLVAKELGLNLNQFEADRTGEAATAKLKSDIELAKRLNVNYTPTIFLNGRHVRDTRLQSLQLLIADQIEHAH